MKRNELRKILIEDWDVGELDIDGVMSEIDAYAATLTDTVRALANRQTGFMPSGGESKRGWVYAHDIYAALGDDV